MTTSTKPSANGHAYMDPTANVLSRLENVRGAGDGKWQAFCPMGHDDRTPSLSIARGDDDRCLLDCKAGCDTTAVVRAMGLEMKDLFVPSANGNGKSKSKLGRLVASYDYRSQHDNLVSQVRRYDPKDFRQRRPDPSGKKKWLYTLDGIEQVPYLLPKILKHKEKPVHIAEGEEDVLALDRRGLIATCNAMGAAKKGKDGRKPKCKWKADHSKWLKDRDVVIFRDNDEAGRDHGEGVALSLYGVAASIKIVDLPGLAEKGDVRDWLDAGGTVEQLQQIIDATPYWEPSPETVDAAKQSGLPEVLLPGGDRSITATAEELGRLLAKKQSHFQRGGTVVRFRRDEHDHPLLEQVDPASLPSDFEAVAFLTKETKKGSELTICNKSTGELILKSQAFVDRLPAIRVVSRCPVLIERDGELIEVNGYDAGSGVFADGPPAEPIALDDAKKLILDALDGFLFASPAGQSRAVTMMIQPAMLTGGLINGRAAIDLGEADQSQTGKGFRNKITAAIYRHVPATVAQRSRGVGSLEDSISSQLIAGATFLSIDNFRGKLDSPQLESLVTEDIFLARSCNLRETRIDVRRLCLMFTSNRAELTKDLANRCCCVRILKRPDGYQFQPYFAGDILDNIRAHQPDYLGCVFAILRAWHAAGKPRTDETRHDFRAAIQPLDWIVQNIFGLPPMMDGHRETQERMSSPTLNWLRDVAIAVLRQKMDNKGLQANDILEILLDEGGIQIPGAPGGENIADDSVREQAWKQIGRRLGKCFARAENDTVEIDRMTVRRESYVDNGRDRYRYWFCNESPP